MQLSHRAREELKNILREEIGQEGLRRFTDEGINDLGVRLLRLTAVCLKVRAERQRRNAENEDG